MKSAIEWFNELGVPFYGDITIQDIIRIQEDAIESSDKDDKNWKNVASNLNCELSKIHSIVAAVAKGIHTDKVDAQITMSIEDQQKDLVEVLTREINRKPQ